MCLEGASLKALGVTGRDLQADSQLLRLGLCCRLAPSPKGGGRESTEQVPAVIQAGGEGRGWRSTVEDLSPDSMAYIL